MSHKVYRLCLLSVVIIAIVGGIFYYLNYVKDENDVTEGTMVRQEKEKGDILTFNEEEDGPFHEGIEDEIFYEEAEDIPLNEGAENE